MVESEISILLELGSFLIEPLMPLLISPIIFSIEESGRASYAGGGGGTGGITNESTGGEGGSAGSPSCGSDSVLSNDFQKLVSSSSRKKLLPIKFSACWVSSLFTTAFMASLTW